MPAKLTARQAKKYDLVFAERRSKYRNRKTVVDGITFDSKKEAERWLVLKDLEERGQIFRLQRQVRFDMIVRSNKICSYQADFVYYETPSSMKPVVEDVKGYRTREYRLKKKLFEALYTKIKEI